jgi:hypothetical protein
MLFKAASATLAGGALVAITATSIAHGDTGISNGASYTTSTTSIDTSDGWHVTVGQLSGGNSAVATVFNNASRASGRTMAATVGTNNVFRTDADFDAHPTVIFRPTAVAQVLTGVYFWHHAAHPLDYVTTVVIDSRTARPITLDDLFTDTQAGLNRLSEQTKILLPAVYGRASTPDGDLPGNAPLSKNFHNWVPTATGLEIHFEDYQFAHGLPVITVPWSTLNDVLAPSMQVLAQ